MTSFVSMNGPSVTVSFPPASRTRAPAALWSNPPISTIVPFLKASSPSFPIASISAWGGGPWFSTVLTRVMKRIVDLLLVLPRGRRGSPTGACRLPAAATDGWPSDTRRTKGGRIDIAPPALTRPLGSTDRRRAEGRVCCRLKLDLKVGEPGAAAQVVFDPFEDDRVL